MIEVPYRDLLRRAYDAARRKSDDNATHNGAVLVDKLGGILSEAANEFPKGVAVTDYRLERPLKYSYMEHAERNAIFAAARLGLQVRGATLVCPWFACVDCARAIIQAGITEVIGHKQVFDRTPDRWKETIATADAMLDEACIVRRYFDGEIGDVEVLFNGEWWKP